jgi:hypothetical protein
MKIKQLETLENMIIGVGLVAILILLFLGIYVISRDIVRDRQPVTIREAPPMDGGRIYISDDSLPYAKIMKGCNIYINEDGKVRLMSDDEVEEWVRQQYGND